MRMCRKLLESVTRRKSWDTRSLLDTPFNRCLNIVDLIGIGIGSSAGIGIYVLSAHVARCDAGPASVLSVLLAGVTSLLAGLCEAELTTRLPKAGTSYVYSYSVFGELSAFITGWSLILEHVLGAAVAAKAWGHYLDYMLNDTLHKYLAETWNWGNSTLLATTPDVLGCSVLLVSTLLILLSVKIYSVVNFVLMSISGLFVLSFICVGFFHIQTHNWTKSPGFFPHGVRGMTSGAALMVYGFSGIDNVATASQESKQTYKHVPTAIVSCCIVVFFVYFGSTASLTLSYPWSQLAERAPLSKAFEGKHIFAAKYVIGIGALLGLLASVLGFLFSLPRNMYAMSKDGLLPRCLSRVSSKSKTPMVSTFLIGVMSAVVSLFLNFESAVEMLSAASLFSYFVCAISVVCLRYQTESVGVYQEYSDAEDTDYSKHGYATAADDHTTKVLPKLEIMANGDMSLHYDSNSIAESHVDGLYMNGHCCRDNRDSLRRHSSVNSERTRLFPKRSRSNFSLSSLSSMIRLPSYSCTEPSQSTWGTARCALVVFIISSTCMCLCLIALSVETSSRVWWAVTASCISAVFMITAALFVAKQPQNRTKLYFRTPYVPFVPLLLSFLAMVLIAALPFLAWIRFSGWIGAGLLVYFLYGIRHSTMSTADEQEVVLYDVTNPEFTVDQMASGLPRAQ
ncbi:cationic amino acid transporter 2-like [Gigantopelta aegis]|uniref:cationic amino acid transporter 2-like n=1 Tax=Gigantopelta aegis TaxID=1735272 RepID=UPI001B889E77|nr:cationic amino acid transporter 2-like [Gigantopelta aegis]